MLFDIDGALLEGYFATAAAFHFDMVLSHNQDGKYHQTSCLTLEGDRSLENKM